jgi:hypothetical protein
MRVGRVSSHFDNYDEGVVLAKAAFSNIMNATSYCKIIKCHSTCSTNRN